jgi:hypothetical protein
MCNGDQGGFETPIGGRNAALNKVLELNQSHHTKGNIMKYMTTV